MEKSKQIIITRIHNPFLCMPRTNQISERKDRQQRDFIVLLDKNNTTGRIKNKIYYVRVNRLSSPQLAQNLCRSSTQCPQLEQILALLPGWTGAVQAAHPR